MERILEMLSKVEKYIYMAKRPGVENVIAITPHEIVFDSRTLLKCMFGCSDWGKGCTCPSREGALKPWELEPMLRKYKTVLIIHSTSKRIAQEASYEVEIEAYLDGDALAFSMSDCAICEECAGRTDLPCRDVTRARPAFHSVGIDVFATAKNLNLPLKALRNTDDQQNWYSAVWLN